MPETLDDLLAECPAEAEETVEIDASILFGKEEGTVKFVYSDPEIPEVFAAGRDAESIRKMRPGWPAELCQVIALLALAHRKPAPGNRPVGHMYIELAEKHRKKFGTFSSRFLAAFPHLMNLEAAAADKKGDSPPETS